MRLNLRLQVPLREAQHAATSQSMKECAARNNAGTVESFTDEIGYRDGLDIMERDREREVGKGHFQSQERTRVQLLWT